MAKVRRGGQAYYLEVAGDGGRPGIEAPGAWLGAGSEELGLGGMVTGDDLGAVLGGAHPGTGERLGPSHHRVTVAAYDLSFCAPKSVSLLHALGSPEVAAEVRAAHVSAVDAALSYVGDRAAAVRRSVDGVRLPLRADAVASAGFVHRVSRALDPHLHTHVVMANLGRGPEGTWSALDGRGLYAHVPAAGALYHVQLRHEMTGRLGVAWGPLRSGRADIDGIGVEARRAFSQRAAAIAQHLSERGLSSRVAKEIASHATRPDRRTDVAPEDLGEWWQARARAVGLHPERLAGVLDRAPRRGPPVPEAGRQDHVMATLVQRGHEVCRRDVVRAWCESLPTGAPSAEVERDADRLLASLTPAETGRSHRGNADVRGVGERRHLLTATLERGGPRRRDHELARALAARSMTPTPALAVHPGRGRELERDVGIGLG